MNPTVGTFISQSKRASMNFAISYGSITVFRPPPALPLLFTGEMPLVSFAWLDRNATPRHRPIIHSLN